MEAQNFFRSRFGKKNTLDRKICKVYFQRKIKTENYPNIQKKLNTFFNDYSKYFDTSFEENHIIVGKKYDNIQKKNIPLSLTESGVIKSKNKRLMKRPTLKRPMMSRADSMNRSKLFNDEKRKSFEENILKPGQRFIEDKEVDKLFNLYRELRKINKNRSNNFISLKELKELKEAKEKNEKNFINKSTDNFFKMNTINYDKNFNFNFNVEEKKYGTIIMRNSILDINNINNESEYNKTISTNIGGNVQDDFNKNNKNMKSIENDKEENQKYICNTDIIKRRKKLIERQNQYLYQNINQSIKNQFKESLALQENVFLNQNKTNKMQKFFKKYLQNHVKKDQNIKLLMLDDTHRSNVEFKMKINTLQNKLNPDRIYNWYYDLHSSKNSFPILDTKLETVRNPKNMKAFDSKRSKTLEKDDYLKNTITLKNYKNLEKELNHIDNNYGGLIVEVKNLLQL